MADNQPRPLRRMPSISNRHHGFSDRKYAPISVYVEHIIMTQVPMCCIPKIPISTLIIISKKKFGRIMLVSSDATETELDYGERRGNTAEFRWPCLRYLGRMYERSLTPHYLYICSSFLVQIISQKYEKTHPLYAKARRRSFKMNLKIMIKDSNCILY